MPRSSTHSGKRAHCSPYRKSRSNSSYLRWMPCPPTSSGLRRLTGNSRACVRLVRWFAAALGEDPPADAGDEVGPQAVRTKAEILTYLKGSFAHLDKAIEAIGQTNVPVNPSPISPLKKGEVTRSALVTESLMHAADHYGQIVEYLRMNGVVPPASRQ